MFIGFRKQRRIDRLKELQVFAVVNIFQCGGNAVDTRLDFYQPLGLKKQENPPLFGFIVTNLNGRTVFNLADAFIFFRIDAERFDVDFSGIDEMGPVLLIVKIEIGNMLKIIGSSCLAAKALLGST